LFAPPPTAKLSAATDTWKLAMFKTLCAALALVVLAACVQQPSNQTAPRASIVFPGGMIGVDPGFIADSHFFTFIDLTPTAAPEPRGVSDDRPSAAQTYPFVDVTMTSTVDPAHPGRITAMTLTLARSFIDGPATAGVAREIADSFLSEAPSPAAVQQISALINDVKGSSTPGYVPQTPAYAVFAGASQAPIEMNLTGSQFVIAPSREGGAPAEGGVGGEPAVEAGAPAVSLSFTAR
jgi:hypothetical protein